MSTEVVVYDGFENFERALARGKGVLFLTAILAAGSWFRFAHSLHGHPMQWWCGTSTIVYLDRHAAAAIAPMHGNTTVEQRRLRARALRGHEGRETVGILMDTNMTPPQGVFVHFFGIPGVHRQRTGADRLAYRCRRGPRLHHLGSRPAQISPAFDPAVNLVRTGDDEADAVANTAAVYQNYRGLRAPLPRPVALGPSPLEDKAAGGT